MPPPEEGSVESLDSVSLIGRPIHPRHLSPEEKIQAFRAIAEGASLREMAVDHRMDREGIDWMKAEFEVDFDRYTRLAGPGSKNQYVREMLARLKGVKSEQ